MSFTGKNPKFDFLNTAPQSADPSNPQEGDIYYSDGTPRDEGLWIYQDAGWQQFSTGATLSTVANLTLTPQSADPGTPAEGMLFRADGTSRAEGIWEYRDGGWVQITGQRSSQEFFVKDAHYAMVASTANVNINTQVQAGNTINGVTLLQNDIVLLKDQTTTTENGLYFVQAAGAPIRHPLYATAADITNARIYAIYGTTSPRTFWYQNNTIVDLNTDAQSWSSTLPASNFTVPDGVYKIKYTAVGGGGGGAGGASNTASTVNIAGSLGAQAGSGGTGAPIITGELDVTPGETIAITLGTEGACGIGATSSNGTAGSSGGNTTIVTLARTITAPGGAGGVAGTTNTANNTGGGIAVDTTSAEYPPYYLLGVRGGNGGNSNQGNAYGRVGNVGKSNLLLNIAGGGYGYGGPNQGNDNFAGGAGGGGGGASIGVGGTGGHGGGPYFRDYDIIGVTRASNIVTITMSSNYGYTVNPILPGDFVQVYNISPSYMGGQRVQVLDTPTSATFRYYCPGSDGTAGDQTGNLYTYYHSPALTNRGAGGGGGGGAGGNYVHNKPGMHGAPGGRGYVKLEW